MHRSVIFFQWRRTVDCSICHTRKASRACSVINKQICSQCCGTERENTLDCPAECTHLQNARTHEKMRSNQDIQDQSLLFSDVILTMKFVAEQEEFSGGLALLLAQAACSDHTLRDRDVLVALSTLAREYQHLASGNRMPISTEANESQKGLIDQLRVGVVAYRKYQSTKQNQQTLTDIDVYKSFVFLIRTALARTSGRPFSRSFTQFLSSMGGGTWGTTFTITADNDSMITSGSEAS